ncbi:unnamed protein product [Rotaria socialis]|uniref:MULE transposase domain-containing protein n=2 Tax=Rotaria socialis TaxID=392032 RepID=A0A818PD10_9BILA|nr:unnamed protein product [Rotaria socialis]
MVRNSLVSLFNHCSHMATFLINGTTKNKPRLDCDGYSYIMDRSTNDKTYWRCIKYSSDCCRSRLHTCILTNTIVKPPSEHICKVDGTTLQLRMFNEHVAHRAVNTQETPDIIVTNCYKGMFDPSIARLPVRDNIKRRIRMLRQNNRVVKEPNDPNFSSVPLSLTKTIRNDQFLRCDTGPGEDRILMFASDEQADNLQDTEEFLVDGTFKIVPEIFYQLHIIHGVFRDHVVPLIYALLRQKNTETYQRLINEILKIAPRWSPRSIMINFEQASIGAFQAAFPNVSVSGCYFHLRKSLHRKIQAIRNLKWLNDLVS